MSSLYGSIVSHRCIERLIGIISIKLRVWVEGLGCPLIVGFYTVWQRFLELQFFIYGALYG